MFVIKRNIDDRYAKLDKTWFFAEWVYDVTQASAFPTRVKATNVLFNKLIGNKHDHSVVEVKLSVV